MQTTNPNQGVKMQSTYSWMGSPLHLVLEDEFAEAYNQAMDAWFEAQENHKVRTGHEWDPVNEPILIDWTDDQRKAWDDFAKLMNLLIEINRGNLDIPEEVITSDYLVKVD